MSRHGSAPDPRLSRSRRTRARGLPDGDRSHTRPDPRQAHGALAEPLAMQPLLPLRRQSRRGPDLAAPFAPEGPPSRPTRRR